MEPMGERLVCQLQEGVRSSSPREGWVSDTPRGCAILTVASDMAASLVRWHKEAGRAMPGLTTHYTSRKRALSLPPPAVHGREETQVLT